jgi:hypothetical protein
MTSKLHADGNEPHYDNLRMEFLAHLPYGACEKRVKACSYVVTTPITNKTSQHCWNPTGQQRNAAGDRGLKEARQADCVDV